MKTVAAVAWRNLWRNRRRTALTAGGIGFAVALLAFAIAQQIGSYSLMIDNATSLMTGHLQVQHTGYCDDPRLESTVLDSAALRARIERLPGVRGAAERVEAFALVSAGERTVAGRIVGVDPKREPRVSTLPGLIASGRFLTGVRTGDGAVEAFAGEVLARNLGVGAGDEIVILGTDREGGIAALATRLVGTFATGQAEIDRSMLLVPLDAMRDAFVIGDEAHAIVVRANDAASSGAIATAISSGLAADDTVLEWPALLPELEQSIDLDRVSSRIFYGLLALLVTFSVVNSFVMVVFERTGEFGLLLAIGMRPWRIVGMLQLEALWLGLLGAGAGLAVAVPLVAWVAAVGLPLGDSASEMLRRFHMPDRLYTAFDLRAFVEPTLLMLAATAAAALLPSLRLRRLAPVDALRAH